MSTHTHQFITRHFSSLRHAKILGRCLMFALLIGGSSFAAPLQIPGLSRANIGIKKVFLSTNGESTNAGTSQIILDGTNGDVTIAGTVQIPTHKCITAGNCTLKVGPAGVLALTSAVAANGGSSTSTGELYTRDGSTPTDTEAYDIYFGDPALTTGTVTDSVKVRVGLEGTGTGNTSQLLARGKIETRERLQIIYPFISANATNLSVTAGIRTDNQISSETSSNQGKALSIRSQYYNPLPSESNIILRSGTGSVPTRVGVNIPSGEYATRALDVAGQTLSRNTLHVSGNNSVFYARPTAGAISGAVGIRTTNPNQTLHVSGDSRLFGKATFVGNTGNLNSTTNGMTSTKLMEINKNTATTLTLEEVGCKILSVNETGHMVLTQVDAALCTPTNPNGTGNCPPLPTNAIANTVLTIPQVFSGGMWVPDPVWSYNVISSTTECRYTCATGYVQGSNLTPGYNYGLGSGNWTMTYGGSPIIKKQSNGKTIIFSHYMTQYSGVTVNGIARLNTDGTLDTTFNAGGSGFTLNPIRNIGTDMHVQPDDKIVAVGMFTHYNGTSSKGIIRLNANGSIDTSFNVGAGFNGIVQLLKPLPNNQYFVLGYSTSLYNGTSIPNFAKLNSNGSLDTAFMSNYTPAPGSWAIYDIKTQSSGKFIFGFAGSTSKMLTRYNTNGTTDTSFNNGGAGFTPANAIVQLWAPGGRSNYSNPNVTQIAILPNDSIIAVGAFSHYNGYPANNIVKVDQNGNLDTIFMGNVGIGLDGYGAVAVYDQFNNRVFIGGGITKLNNQTARGLVAINQNGTLNPSFPTTGFNKVVSAVTVLDANTFYVQGEFNTFGPYSTLPGAAVFGPGCIPESFGSAQCGTSHLSNATSQPANPPIANVCASGIFSGFVGSSPRGWSCTNPVTNNSVACCTKYGMSISTGGIDLINSYKDLINNVGVNQINYGSNASGAYSTRNVSRTMPTSDYIFGSLSGALWPGQQVSYTSFYYTGAGFYANSGTFNYLRTIWGGTAFSFNYYGAQVPSPIIPNTPAYYPYMQQNHVYAAMLVPVATYQAFTGNKGYSAQNKIGGRWTGELRDLGIMIKDLDIISGAYLEGSGGYISLTEPTEYNAANSSKGIIVVAKRKSSAVYEQFYILANYNRGGTVRWKKFDTCANQTTGYIPPTPTTAICGSSNGGTFSSIPTTNLCATGTASAVIGSGNQRLWSCGNNYGAAVNCSATNVNTPPIPSCYNCPTGYTLTGDLDSDGIPNCYSGTAGTNTTVYAFANYNSRVSGHMFDPRGNSVSYVPSGIGGGNLPRCSCDNMINNGYYPGQGVSRGVVPFAECYKGGTTPYTTAFPSLAGVNNIVNTVDGAYPLTLQAWDGVTNGTPGSFSPSLNTTYFTGTDVGPLCLDYVSANYSNQYRFFGGMAFVYIREGTVTTNGGVSSFNATVSSRCAGNCGTASGLNLLTIPSNSGFTAVPNTIYPAASTNLCILGNASAITSNVNTWTWNCVPTTGASVACSSNKSTNGLCGSANGQPSVSAPSSNLCASGTATTVIATGLANGYSGRSWSCNGSNGGTNDSCGGYKPLNCSTIYARDQWTGYYTMSSNTGSRLVPTLKYAESSMTSLNIPPCAGPGIMNPTFDYVGLYNGNYWTAFSWLNGVNASDTVLISGAATSVINMTPWVSLPRYNVTHPYVLGDDVGKSCYIEFHQHPGYHKAIYTKVGYTDPDNKACTPAAAACGPAHGNSYVNANAANAAGPLCSNGVASVTSLGGIGPWNWDCLDTPGGSVIDSCVATPRDGVCGTADGGLYVAANDANIAGLCNNGIARPSSLVDPGPWKWNCSGTPSATCNASIDRCTRINAPQVCDPGNYRPVCGCDGNDYFNDCYANNANVGSRTDGVCTPIDGECGDGVVNSGEQCDDGNLNNTDNCDNLCQFTINQTDFGCNGGETMVTYTIGDDDNFDPTMKLQGPYLPDADYKDWMSNYFTQGGTIGTPGQNLGNFDSTNSNDYYLAHIKLPPIPGTVRCIGFELKAKESESMMATDSLYLMTKNGPVDPNNYGTNLNDYVGLVSQFDDICSMNASLFIPYVGSNTTVPFTLNVTACPFSVANSINNGNTDLYLRGQDDHNPDYVRIHIGYM